MNNSLTSIPQRSDYDFMVYIPIENCDYVQ